MGWAAGAAAGGEAGWGAANAGGVAGSGPAGPGATAGGLRPRRVHTALPSWAGACLRAHKWLLALPFPSCQCGWVFQGGERMGAFSPGQGARVLAPPAWLLERRPGHALSPFLSPWLPLLASCTRLGSSSGPCPLQLGRAAPSPAPFRGSASALMLPDPPPGAEKALRFLRQVNQEISRLPAGGALSRPGI